MRTIVSAFMAICAAAAIVACTPGGTTPPQTAAPVAQSSVAPTPAPATASLTTSTSAAQTKALLLGATFTGKLSLDCSNPGCEGLWTFNYFEKYGMTGAGVMWQAKGGPPEGPANTVIDIAEDGSFSMTASGFSAYRGCRFFNSKQYRCDWKNMRNNAERKGPDAIVFTKG